jgi:hypothetical protein
MVAMQSSVNRMIGEKYAIIYSNISKADKDIAGRQLVELLNYDKAMGMPVIVSGPDDPKLLELKPGETFVDDLTGDIRTMKRAAIMAGPDRYADIAEPLSSASPESPKVPQGDPSLNVPGLIYSPPPDAVDRYDGIAEPVSQGNQVGLIEETAQGALGGITEFGGVIPAVIGGAKAGAAIGALGGPYAPITVPVGAAIGGIGSGFAVSMAGKN